MSAHPHPPFTWPEAEAVVPGVRSETRANGQCPAQHRPVEIDGPILVYRTPEAAKAELTFRNRFGAVLPSPEGAYWATDHVTMETYDVLYLQARRAHPIITVGRLVVVLHEDDTDPIRAALVAIVDRFEENDDPRDWPAEVREAAELLKGRR